MQNYLNKNLNLNTSESQANKDISKLPAFQQTIEGKPNLHTP